MTPRPPERAAVEVPLPPAALPGLFVSPPGADRPGTPSSAPRRRERAVVQKPDPVTGAASPLLEAAPGRGRAPRTPAGASDTDSPPAGSRTFTIALPPGLKMINLNERLHWSEERRRAREIKKAAWAVALHDKMPRLERVSVTAEYQPPDRRHRDGDNYAKSAKHATDGIVAAGCLPGDDKRYVTGTYCTIGELYPKGRLVLHLTEVAAATGNDAA